MTDIHTRVTRLESFNFDPNTLFRGFSCVSVPPTSNVLQFYRVIVVPNLAATYFWDLNIQLWETNKKKKKIFGDNEAVYERFVLSSFRKVKILKRHSRNIMQQVDKYNTCR